MVFVPFALHFAVDRRVAPTEILKLVNDQRQGTCTSGTQHPFEDVFELNLLSRDEFSEFCLDFIAKTLAQFLLRAASHEEIEVGTVSKRLADQFGLADAATTCDHSKLGISLGIISNLT